MPDAGWPAKHGANSGSSARTAPAAIVETDRVVRSSHAEDR